MLLVSGLTASGTAQAQSSSLADAVASFRGGLEISVDGSSWALSRTITLSQTRCEPATTSPCAIGTAALVVNVRFPSLPGVVAGAKILAQLGESGSGEARYFIRPVPANAGSSVCGGVLGVSKPLPNMRMAINLGDQGTPLPVTCRWSVLAGVPNPKSASGFDMIWSDTATVHVVTKQ